MAPSSQHPWTVATEWETDGTAEIHTADVYRVSALPLVAPQDAAVSSTQPATANNINNVVQLFAAHYPGEKLTYPVIVGILPEAKGKSFEHRWTLVQFDDDGYPFAVNIRIPGPTGVRPGVSPPSPVPAPDDIPLLPDALGGTNAPASWAYEKPADTTRYEEQWAAPKMRGGYEWHVAELAWIAKLTSPSWSGRFSFSVVRYPLYTPAPNDIYWRVKFMGDEDQMFLTYDGPTVDFKHGAFRDLAE